MPTSRESERLRESPGEPEGARSTPASDRLASWLAGAADPERARRLAPDVLAAASRAGLEEQVCARADGVGRVLAALCGAAPFFAPVLSRNPDWLVALAGDDLAAARTAEEYRRRVGRWLEGAPPARVPEVLRRFKYHELARITVRDLSWDLVPLEKTGETLRELSDLADVLLGEALAHAAARLREAVGPPRWRFDGREVELGFCVLGLGKLGGQELNYSSDVDLVYVFESPAGEPGGGPAGSSPEEYFTRLARDFGRILNEATPDGFLYRVDVDLRPQGAAGALVVSANALIQYYELWAAPWEKATFMKARPVAGDLDLGWRVIRAIAPMIYRSSMDFAGVEAIRRLKEEVERVKGRSGETFDVKVGPGGIRDVEFVAQALQLLHGGRIPQVRGRSTERALMALAEVGVLPAAQAEELLAAYRFLRRLENRLQMEAERQTHRMPAEPEAVARLARSMGFGGSDPAAALERALEGHRAAVRRAFGGLLQTGGEEAVFSLFARHVPQLCGSPTTRGMIEELARHFARQIEASSDPERAMNNLDRFIRGVGRRRFYYELLLDRPELVPRLTALFAASEYFSAYFATHPRLIEPIFSDPNVLLLSRKELEEAHAKIRADLQREGTRDPAELELDALRLFHNRELINVGLLDLSGKIAPAEAEAALTEIAEVCLERALAVAAREMERYGPRPVGGEFLVVGMGKLASRELSYGSDLDVIFLYDVPNGRESDLLEAQEYYVRLAQKLIWALRTRTAEGVCYEIDARLRPSGNQGLLVTSVASFARYHERGAQVWERQALLRARPVAGEARLREAFAQLRREILLQPVSSDLAREIHRVRQRMESELARETSRHYDFKTGRGGLLDVETAVQYLQLRHARDFPELLEVEPTSALLGRLERLGLLDAEAARVLREGWSFLQLLSSRLRIVQNRSISDLDEERADLDSLARSLGYSAQRPSGARRALLDDYRRHTAAIREVYSRIVRP